MYGLTNFLSVLWYSVLGCLGLRSGRANAVTLFDGNEPTEAKPMTDLTCYDEEDANRGGYNLIDDVRYTHPDNWWIDPTYKATSDGSQGVQ